MFDTDDFRQVPVSRIKSLTVRIDTSLSAITFNCPPSLLLPTTCYMYVMQSYHCHHAVASSGNIYCGHMSS